MPTTCRLVVRIYAQDACTYVRMCIRTCNRKYVHTYIRTYVGMNVGMNVCMDVYMYVLMRTREAGVNGNER